MLLITGATGNIGQALVRELADTRIRVLVRDPARAASLPASAERVVGDLDEPATLAAAFDGVERAFLLTPGIGLAHTVNLLAAARDAGVRHVVHVSSAHVTFDPLPAMARWHHEREELVRASGIPATFLRPGGYMSNAFDWLPTIRDGYVVDVISPGRYAPIDPADIAAVAARVLTEDGHQGQAYLLTGEQVVSVPEQAAAIAAAAGRPIEVRAAANIEETVRSRFPDGAPPALAAAIVEGFELMRTDTVGLRTDTVQRLLGRPPRTFAQWCSENADAFR